MVAVTQPFPRKSLTDGKLASLLDNFLNTVFRPKGNGMYYSEEADCFTENTTS